MVIIALVLLVIVLSSAIGYLLLQLNAPPRSNLGRPAFIPLIDSEDVSAALGGNWTKLGTPSYYANQSNPTGSWETEILSTNLGQLQVVVELNGFNSSSFSNFAYQNYQLGFEGLYVGFSPPNATQGLLAPSVNYTIYAFGCTHGMTGGQTCAAVCGIALSSVYVVRVLIPGTANETTMKNLLTAQVSKINSIVH